MSFRINAPSKPKLNSIVACQLEPVQPVRDILTELRANQSERVGSLFDDEKTPGEALPTYADVVRGDTAGFAVRLSNNLDLM